MWLGPEEDLTGLQLPQAVAQAARDPVFQYRMGCLPIIERPAQMAGLYATPTGLPLPTGGPQARDPVFGIVGLPSNKRKDQRKWLARCDLTGLPLPQAGTSRS